MTFANVERTGLRLALGLFLGLVLLCGLALPAGSLAQATKVLRIPGSPEYQWNGEHFAHANPVAPKGGTLRLSAKGNFDSMHPYIARGIPAAGLGLTVDRLGVAAPDDTLFEYHGLVAESFDVAKDKSSVTFHLNPKARFHDGKAMTAADVAYTFKLLTEQGAPSYRQYYAAVDRVEVLSLRSVRFHFKEGDNAELPLILAQLPVLPKHYWQGRDFSQPTLTPALGSGPYRVKDYVPGSYVEYERVPDYWARDLPPNKGRYNFEVIRHEYYRDETVAREAFKAGQFDLYMEGTAKAWASAYSGPAVEIGDIRREEISSNRPHGMVGFVFNTRHPVFADRRVRQAVTLAFDFEWTNKALFDGAYTRCDSYFSNSVFAGRGLPSSKELAILREHADQLSPEVLTQAYSLPRTAGDGNMRPGLAKALKLLAEAGWTLRDGKLTDARGQQMEFTLLLRGANLNRVVLPLQKNLARLGIRMQITQADPTQYVNRVRAFDYDMIYASMPQSASPGNEQRSYWTTQAAHTPGSRNYAGVRSPLVDFLVERIIASPDREQLVTNCRALDRVLLWDAYVIPGWYAATTRVAYWNKFGRSAVQPSSGLDLHSWWLDRAAEARLTRMGAGYGK